MAAPDLLIPVRRYAAREGRFRWPAVAVLASDDRHDLLPLMLLAGDLAARGIRTLIVPQSAAGATVRIRRDKTVTGPEAYRLFTGPSGIKIAAAEGAGAYYAVQTLRELVAAHPAALPACRIDDAPDFARRGVYLDCSRGKVPRLETLKALVERLARWKINELQLYIENVFTWRRHPAIGRGYSPLTPGDILALQNHCRRHHVRLVGSLASFGHMEKILALEPYRRLGEMPGYRGRPGGTTLCPGDPGAIRLIAELYEEFVPLFEATDFNICGDEPWELGKGRSRRRADRLGVGRVYLDFLKKIHRLCARHGKRTNAWADIVLAHPDLLADIPKDIVMLNWEYAPRGPRIARTREIIDAGLATVACPGTNAWNSHGCRLRAGMENIARFAAEGLRSGCEGLLNTDWGDNGHRNMLAVSLHNYAYGAAHSWRHCGVTDAGFTERFCRHTFGPAAGRLADSIRTLGTAHEALGLPYANSTILHSTFLGPIRDFTNPDNSHGKTLDAVRLADLRDHGRRLAGLRWPSPATSDDPFLALVLEEFAVASQLDATACRRAAILKQLRQHQLPGVREFRRLIDATQDAAQTLRRVWLIGNRPSRLREHLAGMRRAVEEYRKAVRG